MIREREKNAPDKTKRADKAQKQKHAIETNCRSRFDANNFSRIPRYATRNFRGDCFRCCSGCCEETEQIHFGAVVEYACMWAATGGEGGGGRGAQDAGRWWATRLLAITTGLRQPVRVHPVKESDIADFVHIRCKSNGEKHSLRWLFCGIRVRV